MICIPQIIRKKSFPEYFESLNNGIRMADIRLEDFRVGEGDTIVFEEWDPKTKKYTGRKTAKMCKKVMSYNPTKIYTYDKIKQFGLVLMELTNISDETAEHIWDRNGGELTGKVRIWGEKQEND